MQHSSYATNPSQGQLGELIELFFQELRAFGVLTSLRRPFTARFEGYLRDKLGDLAEPLLQDEVLARLRQPDKRRFESYLRKRIAIITSVVQVAESTGDLSIRNHPRPILYNTQLWPENTPIAGYSEETGRINYSHLLFTYTGNWFNEFSWGPALSRPLKAALWMWSKKGLEGAIDYLFDLQKNGFFTCEESVGGTIDLLIRSQVLGENVQQIIAAYFGGVPPRSEADWLSRNLVEVPRKVGEKLKPSIAQPILEYIIFDTLREIERVRSLADPVEWILNQASVMLRCIQIVRLCRGFQLEQTAMLKTILGQLEEIAADCGTYFTCEVQADPRLSPLSSQVQVLVEFFRYQYGNAGEARLYKDRLVYPSVLREHVTHIFESGSVELPDEWDIVPPRILWPLLMRGDHFSGGLRKEVFTLDQIERVPEVSLFFEKNNITSQKEKSQLLNEIYLERAIDKTELVRALLPLTLHKPIVTESVRVQLQPKATEPSCPQLSKEQHDQLIEAVQVAHAFLCQEEIQASVLTRDLREKGKILDKLHALYPWEPTVYLKLAIFYNEQGDLQQAWDHILTAVVLDLENIHTWHTLSTILHRLGKDSDSRLASMIYRYMDERKSK